MKEEYTLEVRIKQVRDNWWEASSWKLDMNSNLIENSNVKDEGGSPESALGNLVTTMAGGNG